MWLKASTLVEVLVTMALAGILLLAVYDGLEILNSGINRIDDSDDYERLRPILIKCCRISAKNFRLVHNLFNKPSR